MSDHDPMAEKYHKQSRRDIHERLRSVSSWVGKFGLVLALALLAVVFWEGDGTPWIALEVGLYTVIFAAITLASARDYHVRVILFSGLVLIYFVFWSTAFIYAWQGEVLRLGLPLVSFIPFLVVMILSHKILLALVPVQFVFMYAYTKNHAVLPYGEILQTTNSTSFSLVTAALSAVTFLILALIAWERSNTDRRLLALIGLQERIAATDHLTGLLNRRAFMNRLESLWSSDDSLVLVFLDLDHFKPLNDQYGHATGDYVLHQVSKRLRRISGTEAVARLGGDEFAAVFGSEIDRDSIEPLIAQAHAAITSDIEVEGSTISLGVSIGYAENLGNTDTLSKLLGAADAAMRRAKATRSGWARFNDNIDGAALASSTLKLDLKQAIRKREIRAALQPIADAQTHEVVEYELLARWPNSGLDPDPGPDKFIHVAEQLGLLNEILWMTLEEAAGHLNFASARLALNVSPAQLLASDFLAKLLDLLSELNVDPRQITLEVTEEVVFRNLEENVAVLENARRNGILIALDDFGSGYSSLAMLGALPLDKLKIDQSMVRKAGANERSADILRASVELAKQLDLICCVEGVETELTAKEIEQLGADEVQGFWIGMPELVSAGNMLRERQLT
ncbi:MAG: EAL domain-containing protein [Pseudomonadota bacterium]